MKSIIFMVIAVWSVLASCQKKQPVPKSLQGFISLGNEVSDFEDCNNPGFKYWVEDETGSLDSLYQRVATIEYEPVFIQIEALTLPPLKLGYAEERDGLIRIQKVIKIEKKNNQNNCLSKR